MNLVNGRASHQENPVEMENPAQQLLQQPGFRWTEGMRDQRGRRIVDLDLVQGDSPPDLEDMPTAGALLGLLDEMKLLTDVVRQGDDWIVAVEQDGEVQGYAASSLGEAAAWALLAVLEGWTPDED